ncbi:VOC family protein [Pseudomonas putida]|uniref:VOC family protein n=1 Tax=Pseudomonas putida TaxID=303 RepID=UPI001CE498C8|nr:MULTISPECIES: VOC family protein [Pseudomonas]MDZ5111362.1 VOC family protein [Pseudomonas putida]
MSSTLPEVRVHHLGISVPDIDAAINWYSKMLGFELESRTYIALIPAQVAFIRRADLRLELLQVEGAAQLPAERREPNLDVRVHGNKHLCLAVKDLAVTIAGLRSRGADIVFEKTVEGVPMAFIRDNSGNLLELMQFPQLWQPSSLYSQESNQ